MFSFECFCLNISLLNLRKKNLLFWWFPSHKRLIFVFVFRDRTCFSTRSSILRDFSECLIAFLCPINPSQAHPKFQQLGPFGCIEQAFIRVSEGCFVVAGDHWFAEKCSLIFNRSGITPAEFDPNLLILQITVTVFRIFTKLIRPCRLKKYMC